MHQHVYMGSGASPSWLHHLGLMRAVQRRSSANLAGRLWQMAQYLQAFFTLVPKGRMGELASACMDQPDLQNVFIDSSIVRAHACAAGAAGSSAEQDALDRSRGGFSTKIDAIPMAWAIRWDSSQRGGQDSDIGQAENWLALAPEGVQGLAADKGYDNDAFIETLQSQAH